MSLSSAASGPVGPVSTPAGQSTSTSVPYGPNPAGPMGATGPSGLPTPSTSKFGTSGWYLFGAIGVSIALGNTPVAPFCFGILTLALIYQTSLMLQGK